ncbi:MAG: hypothetical protein C4339_02135 [Nitrososphaerota archaeon]
MKDYGRYIIWLDYLDSRLSRAQGRRLQVSRCVPAPTLEELAQAARALGLEAEAQEARHPRRHRVRSGYISVKKPGMGKGRLLQALAQELARMRGERARRGG